MTPHPGAADRPAQPARGGRKGIVVLATVVAALAAFGSTTQTWLSVTLPQTAVQTPAIAVPGSDAATAVTAFSLVGLAAALAASIAGPVARWIIAVILTLAGVGIAVSSLAVLADPTSAAATAIGEALGVTGQEGVSVSASAMPWIAVVAGVLLVLCALWLVIAGRRWSAARRYESGSRIRQAGPVQQAAGKPTGGADAAADGRTDEIENWDRLSRGEDPTR